jgi:hypothetical protein
MKLKKRPWQIVCATSGFITALAVLVLLTIPVHDLRASIFTSWCGHRKSNDAGHGDIELSGEFEGTWYWLRSPDEERRVIIGLYNRYCIRCHGVDGRGIWDIPDVPDFTNPRWQACRSNGQLVRATLEGRGACMPPFRGTITLEEAWGMARYLRTFVPGTEVSPPDITAPEKQDETLPPPKTEPKKG